MTENMPKPLPVVASDTSAPQLNPEYQSNDPWRWVTTSQLIDATQKLLPQLPPQLAGIVGIPLPGMIPASAEADDPQTVMTPPCAIRV